MANFCIVNIEEMDQILLDLGGPDPRVSQWFTTTLRKHWIALTAKRFTRGITGPEYPHTDADALEQKRIKSLMNGCNPGGASLAVVGTVANSRTEIAYTSLTDEHKLVLEKGGTLCFVDLGGTTRLSSSARTARERQLATIRLFLTDYAAANPGADLQKITVSNIGPMIVAWEAEIAAKKAQAEAQNGIAVEFTSSAGVEIVAISGEPALEHCGKQLKNCLDESADDYDKDSVFGFRIDGKYIAVTACKFVRRVREGLSAWAIEVLEFEGRSNRIAPKVAQAAFDEWCAASDFRSPGSFCVATYQNEVVEGEIEPDKPCEEDRRLTVADVRTLGEPKSDAELRLELLRHSRPLPFDQIIRSMWMVNYGGKGMPSLHHPYPLSPADGTSDGEQSEGADEN